MFVIMRDQHFFDGTDWSIGRGRAKLYNARRTAQEALDRLKQRNRYPRASPSGLDASMVMKMVDGDEKLIIVDFQEVKQHE